MKQKILRLYLASAVIGASQLITMSAAMADILNLKCANVPNAVNWLVYWIDLTKGTISYSSASAAGIDPPVTLQVTITPDAFNFVSSMGPVTINRNTGVSVWPMQTPYRCSKDTIPFPAKPARKF